MNFIDEWLDAQIHLPHISIDVTNRIPAVRALVMGNSAGNYFPGMQPVSITENNIELLKQPGYVVTLKTDGIRAFLTLLPRDNSVYLTVRTLHTFKLRNVTKSLLFKSSCDNQYSYQLDGELMCYKIGEHIGFLFIPHDVLTYSSQYIEPLEFEDRHKCLNTLVSQEIINIKSDMLTRSKFFIFKKPFMSLAYLSTLKKGNLPSDGFIFQNWHSPYVRGCCNIVLKWKPESHNSVDFQIHTRLIGEKRCKLQYCCCDGSVAHETVIVLKNKIQKKTCERINGSIVECVQTKAGQWRPKRKREDKHTANSRFTYENVLKSINSNITFDDLLNYINA